MAKTVAKIVMGLGLVIAAFIAFIAIRDSWRESHLQANHARIKIGMSEAEVIAILGEPTSKHISDIPGLYWCYSSDTWQQWEFGEVHCGSMMLEMSRDGHVVSPPH